MVIYQPLYQEARPYQAFLIMNEPCFDLRPTKMFMETIKKDGQRMPRFRLITDPKIIKQLERLKKKIDGNWS